MAMKEIELCSITARGSQDMESLGLCLFKVHSGLVLSCSNAAYWFLEMVPDTIHWTRLFLPVFYMGKAGFMLSLCNGQSHIFV